jgi:hemolysin activation/secretion protein
MFNTSRFLVVPGLGFIALSAVAQVQIPPSSNPSQIQQRSLEIERQLQEDERRRRQIERPIDRTPAPLKWGPSGATSVRFLVNRIQFSPTEILKPEELAVVAREFEGRTLTLADLQLIADQINEIYKSRGIVTAQAIVPPQEVRDGVVQIRLVEGRVGGVKLEGNSSTNGDYVMRRMRTVPGQLADLPRLEEEILRFNRSNDAQLRAEVLAGEQFGETDIALTLVEPPRHALRLFSDNAGSVSVGDTRFGLTYSLRSVTGHRDEFTFTSIISKGQDGKYLFYGVPVNAWGGRLQLGYFLDKTKIVDGPIASLKVTGESATSQASFRQPVWVTRDGFGELLLGTKKRRSINWIDTQLLQSTDTLDVNFGGEVSFAPAPGEYTTLTLTRTAGHSESPGAARRFYRHTRGSARYATPIPGDIMLTTSFAFQYADTELLPSGEQFVIGGDGTVRGYTTGLYAGDRGMTLGMEAMTNLFKTDGGVNVNGFAFWEYGEARPFRPPNSQRGAESILSVGAGALIQFGRNSFARVTLGVPTRMPLEEAKEYRVNFQLVWNAF